MNSMKSITLWIVFFLGCILLFYKFRDSPRPLTLSVTEFIQIAQAGASPESRTNTAFEGKLTDNGGSIEGKLTAGVTPKNPDKAQDFLVKYHESQGELILKTMLDTHVAGYTAEPQSTFFSQMLFSLLLPFLLFIGLWILIMRQLQSGGNKAMSFGKSRAKLVAEGQVKVTFDDVAGVDEAKEELREIVEFLKDPKKFSRLGGKIPKGVLLIGPPGTGKTLLAKAVAGQANVPFFSISGSDFVEMFVGVGASRVRDLFEQAKKNKPCLVFIDEIDAVGRHRFAGIGGGHDEREQTLNQLLVEMDGFAPNEGVILIAATNRPDVLDPALLRPGRFDRQITVDFPDVVGREKILKVHGKNVRLQPDTDLKQIARGTPGFSGADLANIINEAALLAARQNKANVDMLDLEEAKDRVLMGPERRSLVLTEKERKNTAYHEVGHALCAKFVPGSDPVHKITIIPRGRSLGATSILPTEDRHSKTRTELKNMLIYLMGGLAAEEIVFGEFGTGVGNDLHRATDLARRMICEFGMSEKIGPRTFGEPHGQIFLGKELATAREYSDQMASLIDQEVKGLLDDAHQTAHRILSENRELLERVSQLLIERETLSGDDLEALLRGEELPPLFRSNSEPGKPSSQGPEPNRRPRAPRLGEIFEAPTQQPTSS